MASRIPLPFWTVASFFLLVISGPSVRAQTAPTIASLSQSQTVTEGQNVPLTVSVNGTTPFTYQWKKNGSAVSGATSASLVLNPIRTTDEGLYVVTVINAAGSVTSTDVLIAVRPATAPQFYYQPSNTGCTVGSTLNLYVYISGSAPMTYQWKQGGTTIATTTSSSYTKANFQATDAGSYTVTVSNIAGSVTSNAFTVSVQTPAPPTPPTFNYQPSNVTVDFGQSIDVYASVSGDSPMSFVWKRNGTTVATTNYSDYYKSSVDASDAGDYTVTVSNSAGSATSNAFRVTVNPAVAPTISSISNSVSVKSGDYLQLSVNANGTAPLSYQWKKDGTAVSGATSSYFYRNSAQTSDAGSYTVVVSNAQGSITSQGVTVNVSAAQPPLITSHPQSQAVALQQYLSLSCGVSGTPPFTYQWQKNGVNIANATSSYYSISSLAAADAASYTVQVSNAQGSVVSEAAVISVLPATTPVINRQPASQNLAAGNTLALDLAVTAQPAPTYQWYKDGVLLSGATDSSYSKYNIASSDSGSYSVVVTNAAGSVTSANATIAIAPPGAPRIVQDPPNGSVLPGDGFYLNANVAETNVTCQWQKNGVNIPGATYWSYSINNAQPSDAGSYTLVATNSAGAVTSRPGIVTVDTVSARPAITYTSGSLLVTGGGWASTSINVSASNATIRWLKDGMAIPGATSTSFSLSNFSATAAGTYTAEVTTSASTVTSRPIVLQQLDAGLAPTITRQPASLAVYPGQGAYFSVNTQGESPLSYQWRKDGNAIPAAISANYSFTVQSVADAGAYTMVVTNRNGSTTSSVATLTVSTPSAPVITTQPNSQAVRSGDWVGVSVGLLNSAGATYQWRKDGTAISGATYSNYSFYTSASNVGQYTVVASNAGGSTTSMVAKIVIAAAVTGPSFTSQPTTQTVYVGQPATFAATATSTAGTVTYQWRKNGVDMPGQTSASIAWAAAQTSDAGTYTVVATDANGATLSTPAYLYVNTGVAPVFTNNPPATVTAVVGQSVTITAAASGSPAPTYQWRKDGVAITGATNSSLVLNGIQYSDGAVYSVVATNMAGTAASTGAKVTVFAQAPVAPAILGYGQINFPLNGAAAIAGQPASLEVIASGYPPPTVQWRKGGVNIVGATSSALNIPNPQPADNGRYSVVVSNSLGTVVGAEYTFTVAASSTPTVTPTTQTVTVGQSATFVASPGVTMPVTYQWRKNGAAIGGATAASYTLPNVQLSDAGTYSVVVTVTANAVVMTSNNATLVVNSAITFTTQPQSQLALLGGNVVLSATAQGTAPLSYQWRKNGQPIAGATSSTLTLTNVQLTDSGAYTLVASNSTGTAESNAANLTVQNSPYAGIYNGKIGTTGEWFLWVQPDATGCFLALLPDRGQVVVAQNFRLTWIGTFSFGGSGTTAGDGASALASRYYSGPVQGYIGTSDASVQFKELGLSSWSMASNQSAIDSGRGFYSAVTANGDTKAVYTLGSTSLGVLFVTVDATGVRGGHAALATDGSFSFTDSATKYTVQLNSASGAMTGTCQQPNGTVAQLLTPAATTGIERLNSLSTRGVAGSGSSTMIAGFVITGSSSKEVLIRAVGPTLASFGVPGVLANPRLRLFKDQTLMLENDDWGQSSSSQQIIDTAARLSAFPLATGSADAALIARLDPGLYTAQVTSDNAATGVALVEVYDTSTSSNNAPKLISVSTRGYVGQGANALIVGVAVTGNAAKHVLIRGVGPGLAAYGVGGTLADPVLRLYKGNDVVALNDNWSDQPNANDIANAGAQAQAFSLPSGSKDAALLLYLAPGLYTAQVSGAGDTTGVALVEAYEVP
jgi:large repetitive protein